MGASKQTTRETCSSSVRDAGRGAMARPQKSPYCCIIDLFWRRLVPIICGACPAVLLLVTAAVSLAEEPAEKAFLLLGRLLVWAGLSIRVLGRGSVRDSRDCAVGCGR